MKLKKLIKRVNEFGDLDLLARRKKNGQLKKTLKKLKRKQTELLEKLENETDALRRESLENKIRIIQAQRNKGITLRKELKTESTEELPQEVSEKPVHE